MGCVLLYLQKEGGLKTRQGRRAECAEMVVLPIIHSSKKDPLAETPYVLRAVLDEPWGRGSRSSISTEPASPSQPNPMNNSTVPRATYAATVYMYANQEYCPLLWCGTLTWRSRNHQIVHST